MGRVNTVSPRGDDIKFSMAFFRNTFDSMIKHDLVQERLRGNDGIQLCELAIENLQKAIQKTECRSIMSISSIDGNGSCNSSVNKIVVSNWRHEGRSEIENSIFLSFS